MSNNSNRSPSGLNLTCSLHMHASSTLIQVLSSTMNLHLHSWPLSVGKVHLPSLCYQGRIATHLEPLGGWVVSCSRVFILRYDFPFIPSSQNTMTDQYKLQLQDAAFSYGGCSSSTLYTFSGKLEFLLDLEMDSYSTYQLSWWFTDTSFYTLGVLQHVAIVYDGTGNAKVFWKRYDQKQRSQKIDT